jgi:subtilisin family serine protease
MTAPDDPNATPPGATPQQPVGAGAPEPPERVDWDRDPLAVIGRSVAPPVMYDPKRREEMGLPEDPAAPGRYMVELNILYRGGLREAAAAFRRLFAEVLGQENPRAPVEISKSYFQCWMNVPQWRRLLLADDTAARADPTMRVIYKLWPDFKVKALIDRSIATVKADAAVRAYDATGAGITWAVIDSGIEGGHPHFGVDSGDARYRSTIYHPSVVELHRDFTRDQLPDATAPPGTDQPLFDHQRRRADDLESARSALTDELGHGTHVAGIVAGHLPENARQLPLEGVAPSTAPETTPGPLYAVFEQVFKADLEGTAISTDKTTTRRDMRRPEALRGVAPQCLLVSLKVLDGTGTGHVSDIMRALVYIRENLNDDPKILRVHGVNLSVGYDFDAQMFACGQSPLCVEVDRLVKSGVVVVVAAGNTGYGKVGAEQRWTKVGLSNTINDPGNAALAITVGSTHRDSPHTYGVSYFSSKGPTGDGRLKPDLVAPGERITSCAATAKCKALGMEVEPGVATYVDDSGTSMAAPHVSGAIAAFLSIRREFIQRPEEVKKMFLDGATSLGRERYFEGHGLVDLMRTIQSV